jgi:hypothetical protein
MNEEELEDIPLKDMSVDDLLKLRGLYEQSRNHYLKILEGTISLKDGDILAVKLCLAEVDKEILEIDTIISSKN